MTHDGRPLPTWFDDAKFGIFITWGVFAVPGFAPLTNWTRFEDPEWYPVMPYAEMYQGPLAIPGSPTARHHAGLYGNAPYEAFGEQFRELVHRWDPEPWADLIQLSGARYVVFSAKAEDGFLLWPSAHPNPNKPEWQVERDVIGELAAAVRSRGIHFGTYYSGFDWAFGMPMPSHTLPPGVPDVPIRKPLAITDARPTTEAHWRELIERYHPSILWSDYGYPSDVVPTDVFRLHRRLVPDGIINDRFDDVYAADEAQEPAAVNGDFDTREFVPGKPFPPTSYPDAPADRKWEACRPIGTSWGYNRQETDGANYVPASQLLQEFIDIVARGGNLLLNLGPTATGKIPWLQAQRLHAFGWWLKRYGSSIYATRPWERPTGRSSDGLEIRYTASADAVHAIVLGTPTEARVDLDVHLDPGAQVSLEDETLPLAWRPLEHGTGGIRVTLPERLDEQPAVALRLTPRSAVHAG